MHFMRNIIISDYKTHPAIITRIFMHSGHFNFESTLVICGKGI